MILLRELLTEEQVQFVAESVEGKAKTYFIEGPFLQGNIVNKNQRRYPWETLREKVNTYIKEYVNENRAYGELGHPQGPTINPDRISHRIVSLREDGNNYIGKARINSNPMGMIVKGLLDDGGKLGVSSRGVGSLKEGSDGINEVQSDFIIATAADIVIDPSAPQAFVRSMMEHREWMIVDGVWTEQQNHEARQIVQKASHRNLQEAQKQAFARWYNAISR